MKKIQILLTTLLLPIFTFAQNQSFTEKFDTLFGYLTGWFVNAIFHPISIAGVGVPWVLFPLIIGAIFFTIYFSFPGLRLFGVAVKTVKGDYEHVEELPSDLNIADGDNPDITSNVGESPICNPVSTSV